MNKRVLNILSISAALIAALLAIMGLVTHGNTADSNENINREAMWTSLTILVLAFSALANGLGRLVEP